MKDQKGKEERILNILEYKSENFESAEKRVTIQTLGFVSEVRVKPSLM